MNVIIRTTSIAQVDEGWVIEVTDDQASLMVAGDTDAALAAILNPERKLVDVIDREIYERRFFRVLSTEVEA